jgi:hypothetical protein
MGWQAGAGRAAPVSENVLEAAGVSIQEAPYRLNDLIGYHEVGHVVIWEYGLRQTQSWFDEMLATFAAYAFLSDRYTGEARVWDALMQRHIESIKPAFRDLESFNARYPDDIPQETYAWYQAMLHQRVADVHKAPNRLIAAARVSQARRRGFRRSTRDCRTAPKCGAPAVGRRVWRNAIPILGSPWSHLCQLRFARLRLSSRRSEPHPLESPEPSRARIPKD